MVLRTGRVPKQFCGQCGAMLTGGDCEWCQRFDEGIGR